MAGIFGVEALHVLEIPAVFFADPWPLLFSRYGFAWFGGFLGGFDRMLVILAAGVKISAAANFWILVRPRLRRVCHRTHRLLAFRRWRLWHTDYTSVGHELSKWRCAYNRSVFTPLRSMNSSFGAPSPRFFGTWATKALQRSQSQGRNFLQLSDSHGHCALSRGNHPHQSALDSSACPMHKSPALFPSCSARCFFGVLKANSTRRKKSIAS